MPPIRAPAEATTLKGLPMANPFVHLELSSPDVAKSKDFYSKLFGWTFTDNDMGNAMVYSTFKPDDGPGGGMFTMAGAPTLWLAYVGVDASYAAAEQAPPALPSPVATAPPRNPLFSCSIAGSYRNSHVSYVVCSFSIRIALPFAELPIPTIGAPVPVSDVPVWLGSELELFVPPDPGKDPLPVPAEVPPKDELPNDELEEELPKA